LTEEKKGYFFLKKKRQNSHIHHILESITIITSLLKDDNMITNYHPGSELCTLNGNTNHIIVYHCTLFTISTIFTSQWNNKCLKAVNRTQNAAHQSFSIQFLLSFISCSGKKGNRNIQQPINIFNYAGKKVFGYKNNVV